MLLVCHVISQGHVIKGSNDFIGRSPSSCSKFGSYRHSGGGDIMVSVCHVISQDYEIRGHVTLWVRGHKSKLSY